MLRRVRKTGCLMCMIFVVCLCGCQKEAQEETVELEEMSLEEEVQSKTADIEEEEQETDGEDIEIYIHVCGQVAVPGVYRLPSDSRVFEAVEAAGGLKEGADSSCLNQAEVLKDGRQIYIPAQGEDVRISESAAESTNEKDDGTVNINTASKEELMTLNGIGEARAASIVAYREKHGDFSSIEGLKEVEGIKDGIFSKIKDQIRVK